MNPTPIAAPGVSVEETVREIIAGYADVYNKNPSTRFEGSSVAVDLTVNVANSLIAALRTALLEPVGHFLENFGQDGRWQQCKNEMPGMTRPLYAQPPTPVGAPQGEPNADIESIRQALQTGLIHNGTYSALARLEAFAASRLGTGALPASELIESARQFHNLTQGDPEVLIRAPSAPKRDAISAAGARLRAAIEAAKGPTPAIEVLIGYQQWDHDMERWNPDEIYPQNHHANQRPLFAKTLAATPAGAVPVEPNWEALPPAIEARLGVWLTSGSDDLNPHTKNLVVRFARAMAKKLLAAEVKYGYTDGWRTEDWMDECRAKLLEHIAKGDPVDVANYCAFLWHHGASTAIPLSGGVQGDAAPDFNTFSNDEGDYWRDCPDDADFLAGKNVGDTYELMAGWRASRVLYRVTKIPDQTSDDYEVEYVGSASQQDGGSGG